MHRHFLPFLLLAAILFFFSPFEIRISTTLGQDDAGYYIDDSASDSAPEISSPQDSSDTYVEPIGSPDVTEGDVEQTPGADFVPYREDAEMEQQPWWETPLESFQEAAQSIEDYFGFGEQQPPSPEIELTRLQQSCAESGGDGEICTKAQELADKLEAERPSAPAPAVSDLDSERTVRDYLRTETGNDDAGYSLTQSTEPSDPGGLNELSILRSLSGEELSKMSVADKASLALKNLRASYNALVDTNERCNAGDSTACEAYTNEVANYERVRKAGLKILGVRKEEEPSFPPDGSRQLYRKAEDESLQKYQEYTRARADDLRYECQGGNQVACREVVRIAPTEEEKKILEKIPTQTTGRGVEVRTRSGETLAIRTTPKSDEDGSAWKLGEGIDTPAAREARQRLKEIDERQRAAQDRSAGQTTSNQSTWLGRNVFQPVGSFFSWVGGGIGSIFDGSSQNTRTSSQTSSQKSAYESRGYVYDPIGDNWYDPQTGRAVDSATLQSIQEKTATDDGAKIIQSQRKNWPDEWIAQPPTYNATDKSWRDAEGNRVTVELGSVPCSGQTCTPKQQYCPKLNDDGYCYYKADYCKKFPLGCYDPSKKR